MHVVVCSVIPPLFLPWQLDFASPRSHYCMNVTECFVFPSLLLSLQMAFASPRSHYCTNCTVWFECFGIWLSLHRDPINYLQCACPFHRNQSMPDVAGTFLTVF